MRINISHDNLEKVSFLVGNTNMVEQMLDTPSRKPFDELVIEFLNDLSKVIMKNAEAKMYSDLITFAFWIRKASVQKLKERFNKNDFCIRYGRGIVFHVAPSNVPINFVYSLVAGLLCGNANIVRVPGKNFDQVTIIVEIIKRVLKQYRDIVPYICLVRYGHDKDINDFFSSIADVRIVWGGNETITEIRKSPLPSRSTDVTFADRYSLAVIDSDKYLDMDDQKRVAENFYNDTYFTDQNACTSPMLIVWTGGRIEKAKKVFWEEVYEVVKRKYKFQPIQGVDKLTKANLVAAMVPGAKLEERKDNLIFRLSVPRVGRYLINYRESSGFFYEYDCNDITELFSLCNDKRIQTLAYIGDKDMFLPLLKMGIRGVDRIVPIGKTMDFDLIWDGYDLTAELTRIIG